MMLTGLAALPGGPIACIIALASVQCKVTIHAAGAGNACQCSGSRALGWPTMTQALSATLPPPSTELQVVDGPPVLESVSAFKLSETQAERKQIPRDWQLARLV